MIDFEKQVTMEGMVICKCGGTIISNSGNVHLGKDNKLICYACGKGWDADYAFEIRKEVQIVSLEE